MLKKNVTHLQILRRIPGNCVDFEAGQLTHLSPRRLGFSYPFSRSSSRIDVWSILESGLLDLLPEKRVDFIEWNLLAPTHKKTTIGFFGHSCATNFFVPTESEIKNNLLFISFSLRYQVGSKQKIRGWIMITRRDMGQHFPLLLQ